MAHDALVLRAVATGALTSNTGNAAEALRNVAERDLSAAEQFASRQRTPLERAELCLSVVSPGVSLEAFRTMSRKMGVKDPDAALIRMYGG